MSEKVSTISQIGIGVVVSKKIRLDRHKLSKIKKNNKIKLENFDMYFRLYKYSYNKIT